MHLRQLSLILLLLCVTAFIPNSLTKAAHFVSGNCGISLAGQGYHISGGTGGITTEPQDIIVEFDQPDITEAVSRISTGAEPVAILIVDDFVNGNQPLEIWESIVNEDVASRADIAHGWMVYQHLIFQLDNLVANGVLSGRDTIEYNVLPSGMLTTRYEINGAGLLIVQVPATDGVDYSTEMIASQVDTALAELSGEYSRFIVNMSLVILPCDTVSSFLETSSSAPISLEEYYELVVATDARFPTFEAWIEAQFNGVDVNQDPLLQLIQEAASPSIVFAASAGNYGPSLRFALYPGALPEVISVTDNNWPEANIGEVSLPAAWYHFPVNTSGIDVYYAGTSFAAPLFSLIAALYLTNPDIGYPFDTMPPLMAVDSEIPAIDWLAEIP
jgi:subtilisin family serine protease